MFKTFSIGGIHPPENKLTTDKGIRDLRIPEEVSISIFQQIGAPPRIIVERGDEVKTGQLIAQGEGFVSSNIHSSVSGKVLKIDGVTDVSGYKRTAVTIKVSGDEWIPGIDRSDNLVQGTNLTPPEIVKKISEAGIVGLGGATFPSHVKLTLPRGKKALSLIVNGAECEPYLTSDHMLMLEKGNEILSGVSLTMKALGVDNAVVGIENNKKDAIENLVKLSAGFEGISVQALKVKYPQGGEKQLIQALTGRQVPSGGLPIDVGVVVFNVGTMFAVYEAIHKRKPLFERVVTVTGKSLKNPGNFKVRIGTPVSELIEAAGGLPEDTGKIIAGGPMMGKAINTLDMPVNKGTSGILLLTLKESRRKEIGNCIRCSKCINVCPMGIEPYYLMNLTEKEIYDQLEDNRIMDCMECGSCSYICPANRPLLDYIRLGKAELAKMKRKKK